jgi:hypothetical protein
MCYIRDLGVMGIKHQEFCVRYVKGNLLLAVDKDEERFNLGIKQQICGVLCK